MKKRFSKGLRKGSKRENYRALRNEGMIQCRCGTPPEVAHLIEVRQRFQLGKDMKAAKKAAERWMDERGIPHGIFNAWLSKEDFWSARNNEAVLRFVYSVENPDAIGNYEEAL
jgi:hypothetical protein